MSLGASTVEDSFVQHTSFNGDDDDDDNESSMTRALAEPRNLFSIIDSQPCGALQDIVGDQLGLDDFESSYYSFPHDESTVGTTTYGDESSFSHSNASCFSSSTASQSSALGRRKRRWRRKIDELETHEEGSGCEERSMGTADDRTRSMNSSAYSVRSTGEVSAGNNLSVYGSTSLQGVTFERIASQHTSDDASTVSRTSTSQSGSKGKKQGKNSINTADPKSGPKRGTKPPLAQRIPGKLPIRASAESVGVRESVSAENNLANKSGDVKQLIATLRVNCALTEERNHLPEEEVIPTDGFEAVLLKEDVENGSLEEETLTRSYTHGPISVDEFSDEFLSQGVQQESESEPASLVSSETPQSSDSRKQGRSLTEASPKGLPDFPVVSPLRPEKPFAESFMDLIACRGRSRPPCYTDDLTVRKSTPGCIVPSEEDLSQKTHEIQVGISHFVDHLELGEEDSNESLASSRKSANSRKAIPDVAASYDAADAAMAKQAAKTMVGGRGLHSRRAPSR